MMEMTQTRLTQLARQRYQDNLWSSSDLQQDQPPLISNDLSTGSNCSRAFEPIIQQRGNQPALSLQLKESYLHGCDPS